MSFSYTLQLPLWQPFERADGKWEIVKAQTVLPAGAIAAYEKLDMTFSNRSAAFVMAETLNGELKVAYEKAGREFLQRRLLG